MVNKLSLFLLMALIFAPVHALVIDDDSLAKSGKSTTLLLPDLPEPQKTNASLLPPDDGNLRFKGVLDGTHFSVKRDLNVENAPIDLDVATQQLPGTTLGWLVSTKPDQTETVMNLGWRFGTNQQFIFSTAKLHGAVNSGSGNVMSQFSNGLNYRYFLDKKWLTGIELTGYSSSSAGQYVSGSSADDSLQHIAGSNLYGMRIGVETAPLRDAKLKIGVGSERLSYDSLSRLDPSQQHNTSIHWSQILLPTVKYNASAELSGIEQSLSAGFDFKGRNGQQFGVKLAHTKWNDGQITENAIKFAYTYYFGKKFTPFQEQASKAPWRSSLIPEVLERPEYLPNSVYAKPESVLN